MLSLDKVFPILCHLRENLELYYLKDTANLNYTISWSQ